MARLAATAPVTSLGLRVAPLLVDRVCTDRVISAGGVETSAEPWCGEIVVMPTVTATGSGGKLENGGHSDAIGVDDEATGEARREQEEEPTAKGAAGQACSSEDSRRRARRRLMAVPPFSGEGVRWPSSAAEAHFLHRRKILTVNGTHTTLAFLTLSMHEPPPKFGLPTGDYELLRAVPRDCDDDGGAGAGAGAGAGKSKNAASGGVADSADNDDEEDLQMEETYRQTWCWAVARQLLLLFECSEEVAISALQAERATETETHRALADSLLSGARIAIQRLGKGGDTTRRILGGGVVNRFQTRLKPVATFLAAPSAAPSSGGGKGAAPQSPSPSAASSGSKWIRGSLPRLILRRARLTETAMRLAVLGLAADAERFTVSTSVAGSPSKRQASPLRPPPPAATPALPAELGPAVASSCSSSNNNGKPRREMPAVPRARAPSPSHAAAAAEPAAISQGAVAIA